MDDAQHSLQRKLEQERRHLACLCAGFALPHGHGDEADNARDEMAELLAWSHANLCAARIRALEGLLGDLRCSGRRLCMDCGEEIPLSRLLAVPGACRCRDCQQLAEEEGRFATSARPCCRKDCCRWPLRCAEDCASRDSTHPAHGRPLGLPLLQQHTNHCE